jgi:flavodoxin
MNINKIKFSKIDKCTRDDIFNFLCDIEKNIAKNNNRDAAILLVDNTIKTPECNIDEKKISFPKNISCFRFIELTVSTIHESEHLNQSYSSLKNKEEKTLFDISMALYRNNGIQYTCNYREICARLEEAKFLIKLYNDALKETTVLGLELAKDFKSAIHNTLQFTKPINDINLAILQSWNKIMITSGIYESKYVKHLSEKEMLHFLKNTAPNIYKNMHKDIKIIRKELQKIYKTLENQYDKNLSKTSTQLSEMKINKSQQQRDEVDKMQKNGMIVYIHSMPEGKYKENIFNYFDDFKEFVEQSIENKEANIVYVDINWKNEIFKTYIQPQNEKAFADEVLEENYIPEITTNHDEIDVSK